MRKNQMKQLDFEEYARKELESLPKDTPQECSNEEDPDSNQPRSSEEDLRRKILLSALESSNIIYRLSLKNEDTKRDWRKRFIIFCWTTLAFSLAAVFVLIFLDSFGILSVSKEALIAIFTYIIANLFTALFYMIKYVHNDQYLETFKIVTHKLLDYLLADKNANSGMPIDKK